MDLPPGLAGPVDVELAKLEDTIPGENAMRGGSVYELKWDGYRLAVVHDDDGVRLWSRNRTDLTSRFPDVAAAASEHVDVGTVLDGEVVVWNGARLDFDLLQRRLVTAAARVPALAREHPASFVAFDLLARDGRDLRRRSWDKRRASLEDVAAGWVPPLQLSPYTRELVEARRWFQEYRPAGIEGLVVKGAATTYTPGKRGWVKVKSRETREVIVGAVIGSLTAPDAIVAGLVDGDDQLIIVGRSTPLSVAQARSLAPVLRAPTGPHPWPDKIASGGFGGGRDKVAITHVDPVVVVEVTADTALQAGRFRHPLRFVRHRPDLQPGDLPPL
jgi:ATP-dependent DNA ligase